MKEYSVAGLIVDTCFANGDYADMLIVFNPNKKKITEKISSLLMEVSLQQYMNINILQKFTVIHYF